MTDKQLLEQALEALEYIDLCDNDRDFLHPHECFQLDEAITAIKQALAAPVQEPVAWNVVDPTGKIVATEKNAIRGWARLEGYKPTVEGLLGFHEQGWRVVPTTPPAQRTWVGLTGHEQKALMAMNAREAVFATETKLKEKNT